MDKKSLLEILRSAVLKLETPTIQELTKYLSQLPEDIRNQLCLTKAKVKELLLAYPEFFAVEKEAITLLPNDGSTGVVDAPIQCKTSPQEYVAGDKMGEESLSDCEGTIIKTLGSYGYIEYSNATLSTSVYFDVVCFEQGQHKDLNWLKPGTKVCFSAKPCEGYTAPYRATKVGRTSLENMEESPSTGHACQSDTFNDMGNLMKVTKLYGFIKPAGERKGNVYFSLLSFKTPKAGAVNSLEDVLKKGDRLYFSAVPSTKKNEEAPWEAIKVSKTPLKYQEVKKYAPYCKNTIMIPDKESKTACLTNSAPADIDNTNDEKYISNHKGTIHRISGKTPIICFDNNKTAVVLCNAIYKHQKLVEHLGRELDEGQEVYFTAQYIQNSWKAVLVWVGQKPILSSAPRRKTAPSTSYQDMARMSNSKKNSNNIGGIPSRSISAATQSSKHSPPTNFGNKKGHQTNTTLENRSRKSNKQNFSGLRESFLKPSSKLPSKTFHRSEQKSKHDEQMLNKATCCNYADHKDAPEKDKCGVKEIPLDIPCIQNLSETEVGNSNGLYTTSQEAIYKKYSDIPGTVYSIQNYFAFIIPDGLDRKLFFSWEQASLDGYLVSDHYTDIHQAFSEHDRVNVTFCYALDENGSKWFSVLHVWKRKKDKSENCIEQTPESDFTQQKLDAYLEPTEMKVEEPLATDMMEKSEDTSIISLITSHPTNQDASKNDSEDNETDIEKRRDGCKDIKLVEVPDSNISTSPEL